MAITLISAVPSTGYLAPGVTAPAQPGSSKTSDSTLSAVLPAGQFQASAGDLFSLSALIKASASSDAVTRYEVTLRNASTGGSANGQLVINGVTQATGTFTADQFATLRYKAGTTGTSDDILVTAISDITDSTGTTIGSVYSQPVQLTAAVTGLRSINASAALSQTDSFVGVAQTASVFSGFGTYDQPTLATSGNFTVKGSDNVALYNIFTATQPKNGGVTRYEIGLRDSTTGGTANGTLLINGVVTAPGTLTAAQFATLRYQAGATGTSDDIVVTAISDIKDSSGTTIGSVYSNPLAITAAASGTRSINIANSISQTDSYIGIAQNAEIFAGFGTYDRPKLSVGGNTTSQSGDTALLSNLITTTQPKNGAVTRYEVALRDSSGGASANGQLLLNGTVTALTSFTADQFATLRYQAGANGTADDILVTAVSEIKDSSGTALGSVYSPAVQITNSVTGLRSLNLSTSISQTDSYVGLAQTATIFSGFGTNKPAALSSIGNFTTAAADSVAVYAAFRATASSTGAVTRYQVALRDHNGAASANGQLQINGSTVAEGIFTADQFATLRYKAGASGTADDLLVSAITDITDSSGTITGSVYSPAVQITATASGLRSLNVASSISQTDSYIGVAQTAEIFAGFGTYDRPGLSTVGNTKSQSGDLLLLSGIYSTTQPKSGSVTRYEVALRDNAAGGTANGSLVLNGSTVAVGTFTADQFATLRYKAGSSGTADDILVTAISDIKDSNGATLGSVYSPAVQITNSVSGLRSINTGAAISQTDSYIGAVQTAAVFGGFSTHTRPTLTTAIRTDTPSVTASSLASSLGQSQSTVRVDTSSSTSYDLTWLYPDSLGSYQTIGSFAAANAGKLYTSLFLLGSTGLGGFQQSSLTSAQTQFGVYAYQRSSKL